MVRKEAIVIIDNAPPRLTWEQAQVVLENFITQTVARNDEIVGEMIDEWRDWRNGEQPQDYTPDFKREEQKDCLKIAHAHREQSRMLLATLETMMRGV